MKNFKTMMVGLLIGIYVALSFTIPAKSAVETDGSIGDFTNLDILNSNMDKDKVDIYSVTKELFGDATIKSIEYLHNYDDSPDYIYVDFENFGYAVYLRETMQLMEYSPEGSFELTQPFKN